MRYFFFPFKLIAFKKIQDEYSFEQYKLIILKMKFIKKKLLPSHLHLLNV